MTTNENLDNGSKKGLSQNAKRGLLTLAGLGSGALLAWFIKKMMDDHTLSETGVKNPELSGIPVSEGSAAAETQTFDDAFNCAREEQGKGGFFEWGGKIHSTSYKEEWNKLNEEEKHGFIKQISAPVEHPVHVDDEHNSSAAEEPVPPKDTEQPQATTPKGEKPEGNEPSHTSGNTDDNQTAHSQLPNFNTVQEAEPYTPEHGEKIMVDLVDNDGIIDAIAIDENNDGFVDMIAIDKDGDGDFDNFITNETFTETTELTTQIDRDEEGNEVINTAFKPDSISMETFKNTKNQTPPTNDQLDKDDKEPVVDNTPHHDPASKAAEPTTGETPNEQPQQEPETPQDKEDDEKPLTLKPEDFVHEDPAPSSAPEPHDEEPLTLGLGDFVQEEPASASAEPHSNDDDSHLPDLDADANVSDMHN